MEFLMLLLIGFGLLVLLFVWSGGKFTIEPAYPKTVHPIAYDEKTKTVYVYKHHDNKSEIEQTIQWLNLERNKKYYKQYKLIEHLPSQEENWKRRVFYSYRNCEEFARDIDRLYEQEERFKVGLY